MKLYIKYMVSLRCKLVVQSELKKIGVPYISVDLGMVRFCKDLTFEQRDLLKINLLKFGLELMEDKKAILVERIKIVIIEMVHYSEDQLQVNFSTFLSEKLDYDYTYLANLFSATTGITIEHYIISHKIERIKELIIYDELSLTEISYELKYSSVAHMSNQFKKVTGLTPSFFKKIKNYKRTSLGKV